MPEDDHNSLIAHLQDLRTALLRCLLAVALLFPLGYLAAPHCISFLVVWSFPDNLPALHYFSPLEVFLVQLKMALILALAAAYPWNLRQLWQFLLPALYEQERRCLRTWLLLASLLFFAGIAFCVFTVLPLLMNFAASFASPQVQPLLGLQNFLQLAGWLMLAFGVMFQTPVLVVLLVRFGLITAETLRRQRPVVMTVILILAAILTPPDVVSQLMLAIPSWLLFELGLMLAKPPKKPPPE